MVMNYQKALIEIKQLVHDYFADHLNPNRIYHTVQRTETVVDWALKIAEHYNFDVKRLFILEASAWFYDIGFIEDPQNPEKKSARIAEKLLLKLPLENNLIKEIKSCLLATRIPQQPSNLTEQILCDASMFYLSSEEFPLQSKLMRREHLLLGGNKISKDTWQKRDIELLQNHRFKTEYAQELFDAQKKINLDRLLDNKFNKTAASYENNQIDSIQKKHAAGISPSTELEEPSDNGKIKNEKRPDRGIETMFRISSNNHQALSQMADNKAHIMITVNSIIISVLLSVLFRSLNNEPHLALPVAILLMVNVATIIFSILATRPNIHSGKYTNEDLKSEKINLLFFGNFYKMPLHDFSERMTHLMENRDYLYNSLISNLHEQGLVLGKKYTFLRISYNIFMYGLIISIAAFGIAILINR